MKKRLSSCFGASRFGRPFFFQNQFNFKKHEQAPEMELALIRKNPKMPDALLVSVFRGLCFLQMFRLHMYEEKKKNKFYDSQFQRAPSVFTETE